MLGEGGAHVSTYLALPSRAEKDEERRCLVICSEVGVWII